MNIKKRFFLTVTMVAALFCMYSMSAAAMGTDVKTTNSAVNLRTGPGTGYSVITVVPAGTALYIEQDLGDWLLVDYNYNNNGGTMQGYVSSSYVGAQQASVAVYPSNYDSYGYATNTVAYDVNFRSGPGTGYASYYVIPAGSPITINSSANGWSFVTYNGVNGYIATRYISGMGYSAPAATGSGNHNGNIAYAGEEVLTSSDFTNLYAGTDGGSVITQLCAGSRLTVLDRSSGWYKVSYNGYNGWIPASALCKALGGAPLTT